MPELDHDTRQLGTQPPFDDWEGDHAALYHVLRNAARQGLTLTENADEVAALIRSSRWLAAARQAGPVDATISWGVVLDDTGSTHLLDTEADALAYFDGTQPGPQLQKIYTINVEPPAGRRS
ncbi:hypothetical protein ACI2IX_19925 [Leifsonia aquatica]|uniref:hypothetical protein n=1 Tax=Leifsonia aquatica TaxID=144185 RepID=UPI00384AEAF5